MHTTTLTVSHKYAVGDTLKSLHKGTQVVRAVAIDRWGQGSYEFVGNGFPEKIEYVDAHWTLVVPETPLPETWTNRYKDGTSSATHESLASAERARRGASLAGRKAICTTHEYGTVENPKIEVVWTSTTNTQGE